MCPLKQQLSLIACYNTSLRTTAKNQVLPLTHVPLLQSKAVTTIQLFAMTE